MIRINQIKMHIEHQPKQLEEKVAKLLKIKNSQIKSIQIQKKSIDARKKPELYMVYSVNVLVDNEKSIMKKINDNNIMLINEKKYEIHATGTQNLSKKPLIVGAGPAGLFCAYLLALEGYQPILLERGKCMEDRKKDVDLFWKTGVLNTKSNVQFGEGGAGTFRMGN